MEFTFSVGSVNAKGMRPNRGHENIAPAADARQYGTPSGDQETGHQHPVATSGVRTLGTEAA